MTSSHFRVYKITQRLFLYYLKPPIPKIAVIMNRLEWTMNRTCGRSIDYEFLVMQFYWCNFKGRKNVVWGANTAWVKTSFFRVTEKVHQMKSLQNVVCLEHGIHIRTFISAVISSNAQSLFPYQNFTMQFSSAFVRTHSMDSWYFNFKTYTYI